MNKDGLTIIVGFLRELFWLSANFNFHITVMHIPGISNPVADAISWVHESKFLLKFCKFYCFIITAIMPFCLIDLCFCICLLLVAVFYFLGTGANCLVS